MDSFKTSSSKLSSVYGLPTLRGLVLFGIIGAALWFSFSRSAEIERWLFLLMILLVLVHLTDISQPFRRVEVRFLPFDPPFEGEIAKIPVQISNLANLRLERLYLRFDNQKDWIEVGPILGSATAVAFLPHGFDLAGQQALPDLTLRSFPNPGFFRFWRVVEFTEKTFVLPKAVDHRVPTQPHSAVHDDDELAGIEQIRDPRHLPSMDQKLFLKTGVPYRRIHRSSSAGERVELAWSKLDELEPLERGEQFSYWIKVFSEDYRQGNFEIAVRSPFLTETKTSRSMNWRSLKYLFAKWLYA